MYKKISFDLQKQIFIYKCMFLIYTIFLATDFSKIKSFNSIKIIIMIWGIMLLIFDIYESRERILRKDILLILFSISSVISTIHTGDFSDIKLYIITLIQIFILANYNKKFKKIEIEIINFLLVILTCILSMSAVLIQKMNIDLGGIYLVDLFGNSLFKGFYIISTTAGMISYLSISISIIVLSTMRKNNKFKHMVIMLCVINIILQAYVLFKSGARGSLIGALSFCMISFYMFLKSKKLRKIILCIAVVCIIFLSSYKPIIENNDFLNKNPGTSFFSGRLIIWEEGYEHIFKKNILFGDSPNNMISNLKGMSSEDLIGIDGGRIHNIYLDVLYSNGIIGACTLFMFIIINLNNLYKQAFNYKLEKNNLVYMKLIFSFICSMLILNIVESLLIYTINLLGILFWIYIGYGKGLLEDI